MEQQCCKECNCIRTTGVITRALGREVDKREWRNGEHWIDGYVDTPIGEVPKVKTELGFEDRLGAWKVRWGISCMNYTIKPGLYAVGNPNPTSPIFVSANYKLGFDALRSNLNGISAWMLVLDTKGINVWCAAGAGTFGTDEIVNRIEKTNLSKVVSNRTLIVPQLGAPGVSAHKVKERSGFQVIYGPARASDIQQFMHNGR